MNATFITGNQNKADYLAKLLDMPVYHQKIDLDELQSLDLEIIVEHKVRQAYEIMQKPVLVEDVSLGFDALGGLPGPFIKFFVEQDNGLDKLCRMVDGLESRRAIASTVFGYFDGQRLELLRGELHGEIATHPRGAGGYGWDQIFCPDGYDGKTRSELTTEQDHITYMIIKPIERLKQLLTEIGHE